MFCPFANLKTSIKSPLSLLYLSENRSKAHNLSAYSKSLILSIIFVALFWTLSNNQLSFSQVGHQARGWDTKWRELLRSR